MGLRHRGEHSQPASRPRVPGTGRLLFEVSTELKLEKEDIKRLGILVRLGIFKNRRQAIGSMLREELERKGIVVPLLDLSGIAPAVQLMLRLASQGGEVIEIRSGKPVGEIVGEGRQRL